MTQKIQILKPIYNSLTIKNQNHDIDILFKEKTDLLKKYCIRVLEDNCQVIEADGKHGFLYMGKIVTGLIFNKIIKLSYRHYLCQDQEKYTIYRFNNIGYENTKRNRPFICMPMIQFKGELDLNSLLGILSQNYPDEYKDVSKLIKPYSENQYLSKFHHYSAFIDDHHFTGAVQRVLITNNFKTSDFDMKYHLLGVD